MVFVAVVWMGDTIVILAPWLAAEMKARLPWVSMWILAHTGLVGGIVAKRVWSVGRIRTRCLERSVV